MDKRVVAQTAVLMLLVLGGFVANMLTQTRFTSPNGWQCDRNRRGGIN
jgi:hypothetical protein